MSQASVAVDDEVVGAIGLGALVLVGVSPSDGSQQAGWLAEKVANLRIFSDDEGKMNRSLLDSGGQALVVSQFTLYGDARSGRRPSFIAAAQGDEAERVYLECLDSFKALGVPCQGGRFGAMMQVSLVNEGPVTILLDSEKTF